MDPMGGEICGVWGFASHPFSSSYLVGANHPRQDLRPFASSHLGNGNMVIHAAHDIHDCSSQLAQPSTTGMSMV